MSVFSAGGRGRFKLRLRGRELTRFFVLLLWGLRIACVMAAGILPMAGVVRVMPASEVAADWTAVQPVGSRLRLATYNIQDFQDGINDGTNRTPERAARHAELAADIIAEINPDVLVLQEMEGPGAVALLQTRLPRPYPLAYVTDFSNQGNRPLNIGVLSRVPILGVRTVDFGLTEGPGRPPRGALSFVVPLDDERRMLVYGVHLKSNFGDATRNPSKRYHVLNVIAEDAVLTRRLFPQYLWEAVILGDMNVDPDDPQFADDPSLKPLAEWHDLWRGRPLPERVTVPTRYGDPALEFPPCAFDRVFASPEMIEAPWVIGAPISLQRGVDTQNVFTVGGENDIHVSDHYPVYMDIER